jgi:hypothetical protein
MLQFLLTGGENEAFAAQVALEGQIGQHPQGSAKPTPDFRAALREQRSFYAQTAFGDTHLGRW